MSRGQEPERGQDTRISRELEAEGRTAEPAGPDFLSQIVAQTASSLVQPEIVDPALKRALLAVAKEHAGQPLVVEGTGTALILAVLRTQFGMLASRPALLAETARAVTASLLGDPAARLRVEHLWATLQEEAA